MFIVTFVIIDQSMGCDSSLVYYAHCRLFLYITTRKIGAAERADMIHGGMVDLFDRTGDETIRPSTISYNAVINAWSKSSCEGAAVRAEEILEKMLLEWERAGGDDETTDEGGVVVGLDGVRDWCREEEEDYIATVGTVVKPDVVSFTSVIDAWAKSGCKDASDRALGLLKRMEKLYEERGQVSMKPNGKWIVDGYDTVSGINVLR